MKAVLTAVAVLMLSMSGYAQTVTKSANGAIIDCSAFKSDGFTKVKKARTTYADDDDWHKPVKEDYTDIASRVSNEKIYYKLEVSGTEHSSEERMKWKVAINVCARLTIDGGNWRVPTKRELVLIWVLHPELKKIAGFTPFHDFPYWSATGSNSPLLGWTVRFGNGSTSVAGWISRLRVRCVRDID